jgi:hypothetical protein
MKIIATVFIAAWLFGIVTVADPAAGKLDFLDRLTDPENATLMNQRPTRDPVVCVRTDIFDTCGRRCYYHKDCAPGQLCYSTTKYKIGGACGDVSWRIQ